MTNKLRHSKFVLLIFILILYLFQLPLWAGDGSTDLKRGRDELKELRTRIRKEKKGLGETQRREKELVSQIEKIEVRLKRLQDEEVLLETRINDLQKEMTEKTVEAWKLDGDIKERRKLLLRGVVYLYKYGKTGYWNYFMSSGGLTETSRTYRYLTAIAEHDRKTIDDYRKGMERLSVQMKEIGEARAGLEKAETDLAKKKEEIKAEKENRDHLLLSVRKKKQRQKESIKELEANAKGLQRLLDRLAKEIEAAKKARKIEREDGKSGFISLKGKMEFPVKGKVVGHFGKEIERDSSVAVYRKGIEIAVNNKDDVMAVYGGRVIYADQFKGFGLLLIIDHGGGYYTIYAHLDRTTKKINEEINKGDIIGAIDGVGDSTLYFEVRKGGVPQDPLEWLKP